MIRERIPMNDGFSGSSAADWSSDILENMAGFDRQEAALEAQSDEGSMVFDPASERVDPSLLDSRRHIEETNSADVPVELALGLLGIGADLDTEFGRTEYLVRELLPLVLAAVTDELRPWNARFQRYAEDLRKNMAQDVMLKLFSDDGRVLLSWSPECGLDLTTFIRRVVRIQVLQMFRSSRRNPRIPVALDGASNAALDEGEAGPK